MAAKSSRCSSETVLQNSRPQPEEVTQHLKMGCSFLCDSDHNQNNHQTNTGHICVTEAAEGDEMFDVTDNDQYRGDDVGDSLDNTANNSLDREDDDDEDDDNDDDGGGMRRDNLEVEGIPSLKSDIIADTGVGKLACTSAVSQLRNQHCPQESFEEMAHGLTAHGYLGPSSRGVWHSDSASATGGGRYPREWHMAFSSGNSVLAREVLENGVLPGHFSPGEGRNEDGGDQHWKFIHGLGPGAAQHIWSTDQEAAKVVVGGPISQAWVSPKQEVVVDHQHELQGIHHHSSMDSSGIWSQHLRSAQPQMHAWHKDIGGVVSPEEDMSAVRNLFSFQPAQNGISTATVSSTYPDLGCANPGTWNISRHIPSGPTMVSLPQPLLHQDLTCCRGTPPSYFHQGSTPRYTSYQTQGCDGWQQAVLTSGPSGLPTGPSSMVCKSAILNKRGKGRNSKCNLIVPANEMPSKSRSALDQARQQAHPYQLKEQKKIVRDMYPATTANIHTLKASHIVSWYIDYLIHENEHLTQISRTFSLPVNLFLSDDFYFMDSLKKKVHFPSLKFLSWMQQNLPSININAIDFHEGRPPVVSTWNQEWFWQNKSRRDIIHDVFFYFQHRRVTCEN